VLSRRLSRLFFTVVLAVAPALQGAGAAGLIRDAEIERTLDRLLVPIVKAAGLPNDSVRLYIFFQSDLNAFVNGERNMGVTTGLLRKIETPDQLISVLAHEVGHITGGHAARRRIALRNARGPAAIGLLLGIAAGLAGSGDAAAAIAVGSQEAVKRAFLAYNRGEESAADQAAITYMERIGADPAGMAEVLKFFRGQDIFTSARLDPYSRSHPLSSERMALVERRSRESPNFGKGPDPELNYWIQRMRAKLEGFIDNPARVLSRYPASDGAELTVYKRAIALHRLPDPEGALAEVDRLIALRPDDPFYWELKGQILLENARGPDAVDPYRKAVSLAPKEPLIRGYLGRALLSVGTPEADKEALAALARGAADSDGGDAALLRDLAYAYARNGDEGMAALATAERFAISGQMNDARRHALRATELLKRGSPDWIRADDIIAVAKAAE
jgi:predicted Zn-dependent protease